MLSQQEDVKKAYHLIIEGRVQGVSYRFSTQKKALEYQVKGWVKNLADGSVEAVIEGGQENLEKLLNWCYEGPAFAEVNQIQKTEISPEGFAEFRIKG